MPRMIHSGGTPHELLFDRRASSQPLPNRYLLEGMFGQQLYGVFEVYQISWGRPFPDMAVGSAYTSSFSRCYGAAARKLHPSSLM